MFYICLHFDNRYKDFYLPDSDGYVGSLALLQSETDWEEDFALDVRTLDGRWYVCVPKGCVWDHPNSATAEIELSDGLRTALARGEKSIAMVVSTYDKADTIFEKYDFSIPQQVTVGREEGSTVRVEGQLISRRHAVLTRANDGTCSFAATGTNPSYINAKGISNSSAKLSFGDILYFTTGLHIIYLGNMLAINKPKALTAVQLRPVPLFGATSSEAQADRVPQQAVVQFHRNPRILIKPIVDPVEIEAPIDKPSTNNPPLLLTLGPSLTMMLPMLTGTLIASNARGSSSLLSSGLVMVGASSMLAVGWGLANYNYRKRSEQRTEKKRMLMYQKYIKEIEAQLKKLNAREKQRLLENYPSMAQCADLPRAAHGRVWERSPAHADFMHLRLGLGELPLPGEIKIPKERLSLIDDALRDEPSRLKDQYGTVRDTPITIRLRKESVMGILGRSSATGIAISMVVQLAALHSYHDVKIAVLCEERYYTQWSWVRWLPHIFPSDDRGFRLFAHTASGAREVLHYLDEVIAMRMEMESEHQRGKSEGEEEESEQPLPHYVVFCMDPSLMESNPAFGRMINRAPGFSLVIAGNSLERLPKECRMIVSTSLQCSGLYFTNGDQQNVAFDPVQNTAAKAFAKTIAPFRLRDMADSAAIPTMVSFLDIYGIHDVRTLDVWRFWSENRVYEGLRSTIGLSAGGEPFVLDISDKYHGPHGLVAGTTGSGKSVMLQTYILSLALNYHPNQVQFVLIDYKGGGMAAAFTGLPHVAGAIDNLQGIRTIQRALASIQGAIHRREQIFKETGVSNIDDYIRLYYDDPTAERLPHLIIVVDEFAELKKEQPEFMHELISASRVGRSVGLHLILATQKPSNSVDDEIWSNTRFRICLRVSGRGDSMDMLKRPDAAYIKGMGRCYVQIGNDEIFEQVQTSYSGAEYAPDKPNEDAKVYLLDDLGQPVKMASKKERDSGRKKVTQMDAVMEHIGRVARERHIAPASRLWMEELAETVFLKDIPTTKSVGFQDGRWSALEQEDISVVIGLADDLQNQRQIPVEIDLLRNRNHLIIGGSGSGKTTLLQTLALSLAMAYDPAYLQMYVCSLSSRTLGVLGALPHVGDVVYEEEPAEILRLIHMLSAENERRRELFADAATDNFAAYRKSCKVNAQLESVPAIVVLVDRIADLIQALEDSQQQLLYSLLRESSSRGILFVCTALSLTEVYSRVRDCFKGIALQLHERSDYLDVLGKRLPPEMADIAPYSGRGVAVMGENIYELQVALFGDSAADVERASQIRAIGLEMSSAWQGALPPKLPRIPADISWEQLQSVALAEQPSCDLLAGYFALEGVLARLPLATQPSWLVTGPKFSGKTTFLQGLSRQIAAQGGEVHVLGGANWNTGGMQTVRVYTSANDPLYQQTLEALYAEMQRRNRLQKAARAEQREAERFTPILLIVDNLPAFLPEMNTRVESIKLSIKQFLCMCCTQATGFGLYVFASVPGRSMASILHDDLYMNLVGQRAGIVVGGKLGENDAWDLPIHYATRNTLLGEGEGYLVLKNEVRGIVYPRSPS